MVQRPRLSVLLNLAAASNTYQGKVDGLMDPGSYSLIFEATRGDKKIETLGEAVSYKMERIIIGV